MPIKVVCPTCGYALQIKDQYAGQRGKCKKCGGAIVVPNTGEEHFAAHSDSNPLATSVPPPPPPPRSSIPPPPPPPPPSARTLPQKPKVTPSNKKSSLGKKLLFTFIVLGMIGAGGAFYYFDNLVSLVSQGSIQKIKSTQLVEAIPLIDTEEAKLLKTHVDNYSFEEFLALSFREPYLWKTLPFPVNDPYRRTHNLLQFTAKTPYGKPVRLVFLQEKVGGLVLVREVQIEDKNMDPDELWNMLYMEALGALRAKRLIKEEEIFESHRSKLKEGTTYILTKGIFVSDTLGTYEEIFQIRNDKTIQDSFSVVMKKYVDKGTALYLNPGERVVFKKEFPDRSAPSVGMILVQNYSSDYYINKKWLQEGSSEE